MKIKGKAISPPPTRTFKVRDMEFKVQPVMDWDAFEQVLARPKIPMVTIPGQKPKPDPTDSDYLKKLDDWFEKRGQWVFLKSLEPSEIEFDEVDISKPETYSKVDEEFLKCFTPMEYNVFMDEFNKANKPPTHSEAQSVFAESRPADQ